MTSQSHGTCEASPRSCYHAKHISFHYMFWTIERLFFFFFTRWPNVLTNSDTLNSYSHSGMLCKSMCAHICINLLACLKMFANSVSLTMTIYVSPHKCQRLTRYITQRSAGFSLLFYARTHACRDDLLSNNSHFSSECHTQLIIVDRATFVNLSPGDTQSS